LQLFGRQKGRQDGARTAPAHSVCGSSRKNAMSAPRVEPGNARFAAVL